MEERDREEKEKTLENEGGEKEAVGGEKHPGEEAGIIELPLEHVRRLEEELEAKKKDADLNHDRFMRAVADLDNFKKRADREKGEAVQHAAEKVIKEVLPVVDSLRRALEHTEGEAKSLADGVRLTLNQLETALAKFGLEEIPALGERFDPLLHHAISHDEDPGARPGTVVKEFQKGYLLKGRVLRASVVAVAKGPEEEKEVTS